MNWYLVLFGFIGIVLVFFYEIYKVGFRKMSWPGAAIRYGVACVLLLVVVHLHASKEVQGAILLTAFGWLSVIINKIAEKVQSKTVA